MIFHTQSAAKSRVQQRCGDAGISYGVNISEEAAFSVSGPSLLAVKNMKTGMFTRYSYIPCFPIWSPDVLHRFHGRMASRSPGNVSGTLGLIIQVT